MNHPGKNSSLCFSKVAATKDFQRFYILSRSLLSFIRDVLFFLDTNRSQENRGLLRLPVFLNDVGLPNSNDDASLTLTYPRSFRGMDP